ncbi:MULTISPECIES: diacylglycerol kinase family protein [unclassified Enterococcus]|uniref:diacylglycerol kinase family protein n=1 Tax=unclassified Enterococcus TaxID=2608891 RepID=UPI00201B3847|nr:MULTISPECIES: diacylglycerol kinase family protein [unclassified Enterococcus]
MGLKENKKYKNRNFISSFEFAKSGLITAFKEERNMKKHAISALLVFIGGLVFQITRVEWLFVLFSVFLVIILEVVNTAIENTVDLITNYHFHTLAKSAKDMAAGAVLLASILAAIIGMIIFVPHIWHWLVQLIN